jgi:hypothetical protein
LSIFSFIRRLIKKITQTPTVGYCEKEFYSTIRTSVFHKPQ